MKKFLIYIILLISIIQYNYGFGLPDSSATWTIATIDWGNYYRNDTYSMIHDTIINSYLYKAIYLTEDSIFNYNQSEYFCAIREINRKWYFIPKNDTIEYLLYDYAINIYDTLRISNPWSFERETLIIAFEVDSVELSNNNYKRIGIDSYDGSSGQPNIWEYWIEGIGSSSGLFYTGIFVMDYGHELLCFHRNDSLIYINSPDNTCGYIKVGINDSQSNLDVKIYPNPAKDYLVIDNISIVNCIKVYNIFGYEIETIKNDLFNSKILLDTKTYPKIFIIKLFGDKFSNTYRIIKQ